MGIARPALALSLVAALCPVAHATPEEARVWLARMSDALATRKYDGLFTHSNRRQTETMRIVHRMEGGKQRRAARFARWQRTGDRPHST